MSNLIEPTPSITTPASTARTPLHISHSPSFVSNTFTAPSQVSRLSTPNIMNPPIDMKSNNLLNPTTITTTSTTATTLTPTGANSTSNDSKSSNSNSTGKTQVVFIHKLYDMLHDDSISHLIWWSPSLDSFYVTPGEEFSRALAQYFKHTNIASFIRQLNMYGFHKVNETFLNQEDQQQQSQQQQQQQSNRWEFRHSTNQFRKGDTESLKHIKRRSSKTLNAQKEIVNIKSLPPTSQPTDYAYSYQSEEANHYFAHHHSVTSINSPVDNRPRSPSTPVPQQSYQPQVQPQQYSVQPQVPIQQQPQEYIARPSIPAHTSYENATNFKLLDLTNQINLLRNDFFHMNSRCETLQNELKCQIIDSISVLDIVEKLSNNDDKTASDVRNLKNIINQRIQRINMIPIHQAPPMQQQYQQPPQPQQLTQPQQGAQLQVAQQGVPLPSGPPPPPQQQQHHSSVSSSYHLDSANSSRNPSTVSVAAQPYPLNPHYSIYNNSSESNNGFFRKREDSNNSKRNLSVYDPLQPVPSRHNSRILIEEPSSNLNPNFVGQQQLQQQHVFRNRAESTYSPLSNVGKSNNAQQQQQPLTPVNPPRIKTPVGEVKQQAQAPQPPPPPPPSTKQPVVSQLVQPQQRPSQVQTSRTNSLPNPIADHVAPQSPYFIQRNSFNAVYEHQKSLRIPSPRFNKTATPPRSVGETKETNLSTVGKESMLSSSTSTSAALPSVSELDKSIRNSVNLPPIIQHKDEHEGNGNDNNKRRKME